MGIILKNERNNEMHGFILKEKLNLINEGNRIMEESHEMHSYSYYRGYGKKSKKSSKKGKGKGGSKRGKGSSKGKGKGHSSGSSSTSHSSSRRSSTSHSNSSSRSSRSINSSDKGAYFGSINTEDQNSASSSEDGFIIKEDIIDILDEEILSPILNANDEKDEESGDASNLNTIDENDEESSVVS